ncbi:dTDP-4-dehydrorhamnose reductase [Infirmifilum lucidum]|uniref:dTDP-4-dehydrorhamnose reductase n=1 Tax=Infirmifilum lucidum TaxID=2776706 RepID=A0A7L9FHX1_9CREN|nr:dTDP-4-dehydrorhamnose reductase [Infirmifilum lucidum]QOJ79251.1 dTDP-4-dehydrorhamnose reductase [Infirmifilum lucidum]
MRVLVTGGAGLLGYWVARIFADRGSQVYSTFHEKKPPDIEGVEWLHVNLEERDSVARAVQFSRPEVVVHTAAYTDVDGCEVDRGRAYRVNVLGTRAIARLCRDVGFKLIYVSTDYVFDGSRGFYSEEDTPSPVNYYGLTKLLGEEAVLSACEGPVVVRVSGLYGYSPAGKRNFGFNVYEALSKGLEVRAFSDQYLSPTYVVELAKSLERLARADFSGVLHLAGERMSRYEFALLVARTGGFSEERVRPTSLKDAKLTARRPVDSSLNTEKARALGLSLPATSECVRMFVEDMKRWLG